RPVLRDRRGPRLGPLPGGVPGPRRPSLSVGGGGRGVGVGRGMPSPVRRFPAGRATPRVTRMGEEVEAQEFSRADRTRYREKVHRCLDVFERMLSENQFYTDDPMTGLEVELNLVDESGDPALKNAEALAAIADPAFQTELGQFNLEINVPPARLH